MPLADVTPYRRHDATTAGRGSTDQPPHDTGQRCERSSPPESGPSLVTHGIPGLPLKALSAGKGA